MIDLPVRLHTWGYVKKKFAVYLDNDVLNDVLETFWADTLEQMLLAEGIVADIQNISISKNIFTGKENTKKDTIKGNWTLAFDGNLFVPSKGRGFDMKMKTTYTFTGIRNIALDLLVPASTQLLDLSSEKSHRILVEEVCSQIMEVIMAGESMQ